MTDAEKILEFLSEEADDLPDGVVIDADTSLFRDQLLDSMSLTSLISFLEETFAIKVGAMDIVFENLDTVNHMIAYIERKRAS
jgi:acyl carrier protein